MAVIFASWPYGQVGGVVLGGRIQSSNWARCMALKYRPEIDGLRAIAVAGVILFHMKIHGFAGGFLGVDVFFVISGYLISRSILDQLESGSFELAEFYLRRARRIAPALLATVISAFIVGTIVLSPEALKLLSWEAVNSTLSIANIQYWRKSFDYFAATNDQFSLLHTWSLSVEEQFYLVWPALLLTAVRLKCFRGTVLTISVLTVIAYLVACGRAPIAAFFWMPYRIYEFALGCAVLHLTRSPSPLASEIIPAAGLAVVLISFVTMTSQIALAPLLASIGAAAILFGSGTTVVAKILANRILVSIGKISYSLYLVHWPVIFFANYIFGPQAWGIEGLTICTIFMFVLSGLMYRFVEQPFRRPLKPLTARKALAGYACTIVFCVGIFYPAFQQNGWAWRLSDQQKRIAELQQFAMHPCKIVEDRCIFGDVGATESVFLLGDSYVQQYVAALQPFLLRDHMQGAVSIRTGGCLVLASISPIGPRSGDCSEVRNKLIREIATSDANRIVIGHSWQGYLQQHGASKIRDALAETVEVLRRSDRRFLIIGAQVLNRCNLEPLRLLPGPTWHFTGVDCAPLQLSVASSESAQIDQIVDQVQAQFPNDVMVLKPVDYLCANDCQPKIGDLWLYRDSGHLTVAGANYIGSNASNLIKGFLTQLGTLEDYRNQSIPNRSP